MKKLVDGVERDMTPEEIAAIPQPVVVAKRLIAPLAFRRRLGSARGSLAVAAAQAINKASPDSSLQVMLEDIAAAKFIDLDDPEIRGGVAFLVSRGLLTNAQVANLFDDVLPSEEP